MQTLTKMRVEVAYSRAVKNSVRRLRVLPYDNRGAQSVLESSWQCEPAPDATRETLDQFGNRVLQIYHANLTSWHFEMSLLSQREALNCACETNLSSTGTGAFLLPTRLCDTNKNTQSIVETLRKTDIINSDARETSQRVCEWIYQSIEYSMGATTLQTRASDVLEKRLGVCQDFAHAMIALCRSARIPARYISGFNVGEGQMHAWVETLCGDEWIAFDPTHGRQTRNDCVFVACGRDFRDVSPLRARFQGEANVEVETWCDTKLAN